ncbi:exportin-7 [Aphelenchoides avenae]|nr:exportin-7 [Aphelenchus avenae]
MSWSLSYLNDLCRQLLTTSDDNVRRQAEETLTKLIDDPGCLRICLQLLEEGEQPHAPVVAIQALKRLLNRKISINLNDRLELSRYLVKYLVDRVQSLPPYVVNSISKLFALLTKVGWLETGSEPSDLPFQAPIQKIIELGKNANAEGYLMLKLLTALVEETNSDEGLDSISRQRKIASNLRDTYLLEVFGLSLDVLEGCRSGQLGEAQLACAGQALDLMLACLSFDFIGSLTDDTLDENVNIQVPTKWRPVLPSKHAAKIFQNVVQLASVRRLLFDQSDRQKYLQSLVVGVKNVLAGDTTKLEDQDNFHHFCRIISRLKANYQVSELSNVPEFKEALPLLKTFTLTSLANAEFFSQGSLYYLISFWSRIAGSLNYAKGDVKELAVCCPDIVSALVKSRMKICQLVSTDHLEDPFDDAGAVKQLMEQFATLCRCDYPQTAKELMTYFDTHMGVLFNAASSQRDLQVSKKCIVSLVTFIAASITGKSGVSNSEFDHDLLDGEVWKLMTATDNMLASLPKEQRMADESNVQLEAAFIYLLDEFRKAYVADQVQKESRVYEKLSSEFGVNDDAAALEVFVQKIITNLKYWGTNERLLTSTLNLLSDLTIGFTNVRRLLKIQNIQALLRQHTVFEFLSTDVPLSIMRCRTNFYAALTRLVSWVDEVQAYEEDEDFQLNVEVEEDTAVFAQFIAPITEKFKTIYEAFQQHSARNVNNDELKLAVIGLSRDLRGIVMSCTKKLNFALFLEWAMPDVFAVLGHAVQLWSESAVVTTPVLKFLAEVGLNRQSRMACDMPSATSVIIFREMSKIVCEYGNRLLALPDAAKVPGEDRHYKERVKNIGVTFSILRHVLSGGYLPFGVFWIYDDKCLSNALDVAFKMFVRLQQENWLAYPKVAQMVFHLLEIVTRDNMAYLSKQSEQVILGILHAIHQGVHSLDTVIISASCTILDQVLDYLYKRSTRPPGAQTPFNQEPEGESFEKALELEPEVLSKMLASILQLLIFEEVKCQWSMSRPLLGLIMVNGQQFRQWQENFIAGQPPSIHPALSQNKDIFTQNLSSFRKEVESILKGSTLADVDLRYGDNQFMTD